MPYTLRRRQHSRSRQAAYSRQNCYRRQPSCSRQHSRTRLRRRPFELPLVKTSVFLRSDLELLRATACSVSMNRPGLFSRALLSTYQEKVLSLGHRQVSLSLGHRQVLPSPIQPHCADGVAVLQTSCG
jgi:hypothetical protein